MAHAVSRRQVLEAVAACASLAMLRRQARAAAPILLSEKPLEEFGYDQVAIRGPLQRAQQENVTSVLMGLDEDSLLKPFREMAGGPVSGVSLGGWYEWKPDYDHHHDDAGLAPASTFGQWTSALARLSASSTFGGAPGRPELATRAVRLHRLLAESIAPGYFAQTRFPGYTFDKLVCGLMDAHHLLHDSAALPTLDKVTAAALPSLPGHAVDREMQWKPGADISWMWDETYTMPENLFLISSRGADARYRRMAEAYLDDTTYFEPLSRGINVLADKHAYSYVNALCSAMQAYFVGGSEVHLRAAKNGFAMLQQESFATGGWGPDELLRKPGYDDVAKSLTQSHNGFETPCGSYAHMKLTRYLLRATRDGAYGDSMERILHNTVLGALPLQPDGRSFYSSDYNTSARRVYSEHRWPCCSGTLPQVVADYGINTYFREPGAVWVNLYQPSELRWKERDTPVAIEQTGGYPQDSAIQLRVTAAHPVTFALRLRIPAWVEPSAASLKVNGHSFAIKASAGFATIERAWRSNDAVTLDLPMALRLETLPANGRPHPETVALLRGPVVLFAIRNPGERGPVSLSSDALLSAQRTGPAEWMVAGSGSPRIFVPFTEIGDREYTTYLRLA